MGLDCIVLDGIPSVAWHSLASFAWESVDLFTVCQKVKVQAEVKVFTKSVNNLSKSGRKVLKKEQIFVNVFNK